MFILTFLRTLKCPAFLLWLRYLLCKLDTVYRSYDSYGHFTHILHKAKWYIKSFCYIFHNIVENHLYAKFGMKNPETSKFLGDKKKKSIVLSMHVHSCLFVIIIFFSIESRCPLPWTLHNILIKYIFLFFISFALSNVMTWKNTKFMQLFFPGLRGQRLQKRF